MAMKIPVVAFRHGALPEIVEDTVSGYLIHPYDETAMAQAILDLVEDAARRREMGAAACQRVTRYFSADRTAAEINNILTKVSAESSRYWQVSLD
jgi:glycosyltransferase involved in cell wall biosynthesis